VISVLGENKMNKFFLKIFILSILMFTPFISSAQKEKEETLNYIACYFTYPEACDFFNRSLNKFEWPEDYALKAPENWKPFIDDVKTITYSFWNSNEYDSYKKAFLEKLKSSNKDLIRSYIPSYSKAFYVAAKIKVEQEEYQSALEYIEEGLKLEPDHPLLYCEKGYVMSTFERHDEAYELYLKATNIRHWAPLNQKARAFRGLGYSLIELGRLSEAEIMYKKSLKLEANNKLAMEELEHIKKLKNEKKIKTK